MTIGKTVHAIDLHCEGEPSRVLTGAHLLVAGSTMAERLEYSRVHLDSLRRLLLREPRGYPAMCSALVLSPTRPEADFGLVVMTQSGFSPMSGTNSICAVTALLQTQALPVVEPVTSVVIDTAVGLVRAEASVTDGRVDHVTVHNVPAFATHLDVPLNVPEVGRIRVDVAFGGQFVVQANAHDIGVALEPHAAKDIARVGALIKMAAREQLSVLHPDNPAINYIGMVMLHGPATTPGTSARTATVITTGEPDPDRPETWTGTLDRSPCGNATCARLAVLHARGELAGGNNFINESLLGTTFTASIAATTAAGPHPAVRPTIRGRAWITGTSQFSLDPRDPFPSGFTLNDIWGTGT
ncbi:proline racemase family protein [Streptomyces sp. NPDC050315]|uniref:proline racemase family protein n=1 Tax=Streptomyces sp. NPDC050315 TaxID=3155039 RepID=UPI003434EA24